MWAKTYWMASASWKASTVLLNMSVNDELCEAKNFSAQVEGVSEA